MKALKEIQETYLNNGPMHLNDEELLQLLGIKVEKCNYRELFKCTREALRNMGMKPSEAIKLTALSEIARRYITMPVKELPEVNSSLAAAKIVAPVLKELSHEECWVLYLNRANRVVAKERLSSGGISSTVVDVKMIVKRALELASSAIILTHNHPSGNNKPGESDKIQTKLLKEASALFDITLLDHIIIAGDNYFSFADDGII